MKSCFSYTSSLKTDALKWTHQKLDDFFSNPEIYSHILSSKQKAQLRICCRSGLCSAKASHCSQSLTKTASTALHPPAARFSPAGTNSTQPCGCCERWARSHAGPLGGAEPPPWLHRAIGAVLAAGWTCLLWVVCILTATRSRTYFWQLFIDRRRLKCSISVPKIKLRFQNWCCVTEKLHFEAEHTSQSCVYYKDPDRLAALDGFTHCPCLDTLQLQRAKREMRQAKVIWQRLQNRQLSAEAWTQFPKARTGFQHV